jgi:diguanylate cyclase (GGDEF)-like protein
MRQRARAFLLFIDADGLKTVNDSLGHEAGDDMLRKLAQVLKTTFRKSDVLARVGGDEFCVFGIHDDGDPNQAKDRLDKSLVAFNTHHGGPYQLAASVGLYCFSADDTYALEEVVAKADKAMYAEKKSRRAAVR